VMSGRICGEEMGRTRLVGVRRSQRRTVLSRDAETNVSSIGDTCNETTLRIVNSTFKASTGQHSPLLVPAEVLQVLVIMQRMVSYRIILLRRGINYVRAPMCEPRQINAILF